MYTYKHGDGGILYTALSNLRNALEKDIPILKDAVKYNSAYQTMLDDHMKTMNRIDEILGEL